ncbi:mannose-1-phosphate guanylyltransferase/mannose-6-phosphate isomerase [Rhodovulum bhavnagarense]|uniref:mannose-1-phosphate guanylyltransferase n=1 Tax=Rhodovulum bhavnagarense TaxID=992286 RepID=A0A4R2RFF1_9RHOB|nr:mannose-1-phosphate guanylyltransferase/mannose-6-phosphate isomerase [Rhodovulum bhavnagarense]TCP62330.1 mannose-1-phosphate guanylyltransferase/mannose-6-phosphate isomerase [Rhodovulum bhavnagarense]
MTQMTHQITPIILCGGSGTRLWPLSRKAYPKQFQSIFGGDTLFQASARRVSGTAEGIAFRPPVAVTGSDFRFIVAEQLMALGIDPGAILIEPSGRSTAPAVLAAALHVAAADPGAILLVVPSDHVMGQTEAFHAAVAAGAEAAMRGDLVTFGVVPDRAETGYGYLRLPRAPGEAVEAMRLEAFVEKPAEADAERMIADGRHLWNAGIFLFRARDLLVAYARHAPDLTAPVGAAVEGAVPDLGFLRLAPGPWEGCAEISIDYAVMERAENLSVVPLRGGWSDLGSWEAVLNDSARDARGVATHGAATAIDCDDSLLRSETGAVHLVGLGLRNVIAVATEDAVVVVDRARSQEVRTIVEHLKSEGLRQATAFRRDHRPWGHFETLALSERFQVKRIVVKPGAALSLQSHVHRAEHWVVVSGTARVTVDREVRLLTENESVYIPLGTVHRLENPGKVPIVLIEVQTGAYLGEDDIVRYEDSYARG